MNPSYVLVEADDPAIAVMTLNRPEKRNALSIELIEQLRNAILDAGNDARRRVIVLAAAGTVFCAGLDLKEAGVPENANHSATALAALYEAICNSPLVTIAAVQGPALGGGMGLLAACDLAVASENATVQLPEARRGLVAALVACILRRRLNDGVARELALLGRDVSAAEALALHLINRISKPGDVVEAAIELAKEACRGAPGSIERSKRVLDALAPRPIGEDLRRALAFHLEARNSAEAAEGMAAFLEKREPRWPARTIDRRP